MGCFLFETNREVVYIERVTKIPISTNLHVFAICITSDNFPLIAIRRTSFAFQEVILCNKSTSMISVSKDLLKYMYNNELKEIDMRSTSNFKIKFDNDTFEEIILIGGKINKSETIRDCLYREIQEESDYKISVKSISDDFLKLTIMDKLFNKKYISYCTICYINENLSTILENDIYNIEIKKIKSLFDCKKNDKFIYLSFIYNTLVDSK
ncbi:decapping enzyme [Brazilian porcupinepox virus 1]|nr:decapping enzyme [Brazilian porcupinepox virus 1]